MERMTKGFNFNEWLRRKQKTVASIEDNKNARQFEATGEFLEHRTNTLSYESYDRKKADRTSRIELRKKRKSKV